MPRVATAGLNDLAHHAHHESDVDSKSNIQRTDRHDELDGDKNSDKFIGMNGSLTSKEPQINKQAKVEASPEQPLGHRHYQTENEQVEGSARKINTSERNEKSSKHPLYTSGVMKSGQESVSSDRSKHNQESIKATNKFLSSSESSKGVAVSKEGEITSTFNTDKTRVGTKSTIYEKPITTTATSTLEQAPTLSSLRTISPPGKLDGIYASQTQDRTSFGRANIVSLRASGVVRNFLSSGLPTLALIMSALVLCLIFKVCRAHCDKPKRKSTVSASRSNRLKVVCPKLEGAEPIDDRAAPVSFISGGKVIDGLKSIQVLCKDANQGDSERLTLNMDDNSNDSDEQLAKRSSVAFWKGSKKSHKFQGESARSKSYGQIKYQIVSDFDSSTLAITIMEAKDLAIMDLNGYSDPYVRVYLIPDSGRKTEKTRVHKKTLNPVFNEKFTYQISYGELMSKTLVLAVYDFDRFSKHDEIGQISIPIGSLDLARTIEEWKPLERITDSTNDQVSQPLDSIYLC